MSETTITTTPATVPSATIQDSRGRTITIKPVSARDQFKMMKYLGGTNETYMGMAIMAASVRQIDNMPIPSGETEQKIDQVFALLGDEGWAAVQQHYASLAPKDEASAEAQTDAVMAEAKN